MLICAETPAVKSAWKLRRQRPTRGQLTEWLAQAGLFRDLRGYPCNGRRVLGVGGGEGGIRTHVTVARKPHFECGAFDLSATSPHGVRGALEAPGR
jgi:hypothetical protein